MNKNQNLALLYFLFSFMMLFSFKNMQGQTSNQLISDIPLKGNQLYPSWKSNGELLAFQSDSSGNWDVAVWDIESKRIKIVANSIYPEQHPQWVPGKNAIAYDLTKNFEPQLYVTNLLTGKSIRIFNRKIKAKQPSFSSTRQLVVFSGKTDFDNYWKIYSYDLNYDNLNLLISANGDTDFPIFSPKGNRIVFLQKTPLRKQFFVISNWYGREKTNLNYGKGKPSWSSDGWRIFYAGKNGVNWSIYSVREDGTGLQIIYTSSRELKCPAPSPNGEFMSFSEKINNNWKIKIIQLL